MVTVFGRPEITVYPAMHWRLHIGEPCSLGGSPWDNSRTFISISSEMKHRCIVLVCCLNVDENYCSIFNVAMMCDRP